MSHFIHYYAESQYTKWHNAECRYAERHYAECRGTKVEPETTAKLVQTLHKLIKSSVLSLEYLNLNWFSFRLAAQNIKLSGNIMAINLT